MNYHSRNVTQKVRDDYLHISRSKLDPKIDSYLVTHNFFDVSVELRSKNFSFMYLLINKEIENV
jgi:hypothetical protein